MNFIDSETRKTGKPLNEQTESPPNPVRSVSISLTLDDYDKKTISIRKRFRIHVPTQ